MSVPIRCLWGDVVGVSNGVDRNRRSGYGPNVTCKGTHKKPERTVCSGIVVNMVTIAYENGSVSRYPVYVTPTSKLGKIIKAALLFIYVKVLRNDVYMEKEQKWLFA